MINTLLTRIAGLFQKDFLFSSFLPAILFGPALGLTVVATLGLEATWKWFDMLTVTQQSMATLAVALVLVVFAYVLNALRPSFLRQWSGRGSSMFGLVWGVTRVLELSQRNRLRKLRAASDEKSPWADVLVEFSRSVEKAWPEQPPAPGAAIVLQTAVVPPGLEQHLQLMAQSLADTMSLVEARIILEEIVLAYGKYSGESLGSVYGTTKSRLMERDELFDAECRNHALRQDREFGSLPNIAPTRLGNLVQAYNEYPSKRYRMEAEVFWPRLVKVIDPTYLEAVQEPRILLDFALTMATLCAWYAGFTMIVGPWLRSAPFTWLALTAVGASLSAFFYRVAISAALQEGEMLRAAFDLYRIKLLGELSRPHPTTLEEEQDEWEQLSQLIVYGVSPNFSIRPLTVS